MFDMKRANSGGPTKRMHRPVSEGNFDMENSPGRTSQDGTPAMEHGSLPYDRAMRVTSFDSDVSASTSLRKKAKVTLTKFSLERISKVLVIYTGGTVGMKVENGVYVPKPNFLVEQLYIQPIFHDPVFANAYLEALADDKVETGGGGLEQAAVINTNNDDNAFLAVNGSPPLTPSGASSSTPTGAAGGERNGVYKLLAMPEDKKGRRVLFTVLEYAPLLDSSNMVLEDYIKIASDIKQHYEEYAGFVVLHGTDTMAYTASALAFMLENLGKPVILTGSQIPILETLSDGRANFLASLTLAAHYCIPEVCIFFSNKLFRGCCSTKCHTSNFGAFASPNCPPLAEVEVDIAVNWTHLFNQNALEKFTVEKRMSQNVALLRLFPTLTAETIEAFCHPPIKGIVLQTYGAGNGPDSRGDILAAIRSAADRGVIFLNITQCYKGGVEASYATGKALIDAGVVPGYDMTPECALMKLSYVLGKDHWDLQKKREMLQRSLRGELHCKDASALEGGERRHVLHRVISSLGLNFGSSQDMDVLVKSLYPALMCMAAKDNNVRILKSMADMGASVGSMDYDNRTPLHVASGHGSVDCVRYLLECGSPVHARDRFGNTALIDAVRGRHLQIIEMLRRGGAHLHMMPTQLAHELCSLAAQNDVSQLEAWIIAGADVNTHDFDYQRPLYTAVEWNRLEAVDFLLRNNADPSLGTGTQGESPLDLAKRRPDILRQIREMLERAASARLAATQAYTQAISGINGAINAQNGGSPRQTKF